MSSPLSTVMTSISCDSLTITAKLHYATDPERGFKYASFHLFRWLVGRQKFSLLQPFLANDQASKEGAMSVHAHP